MRARHAWAAALLLAAAVPTVLNVYRRPAELAPGSLEAELGAALGAFEPGRRRADTTEEHFGAKDFVTRIFARPFQNTSEEWAAGLGLGFAFNYGEQDTPGPLPTYKTAGQATFFAYGAGVQSSGDRVRSPHGANEVVRVDLIRENATVFDIQVEPIHTYFAGGVLVHNKIY